MALSNLCFRRSQSGITLSSSSKKAAGIMPRAASGDDKLDRKVDALFERWTAECDADGQLDFYGLQTLICREMVEAGEVLVRRRLRRASDGLPVPLQLQVLEADFLDATKSGVLGAGRLVQGIEFDPVGKRRTYWLHAEHPGDAYGALQNGLQSRPVPASEIERAVTAAMREAGTGLKSAWRLQITGAGLGPRLANSIRSQSFPRSGESLDAAALVWSKAPVIVGAHDTGPLIRSKNGFWLAIPLPAAGKSLRGGRITPGEWERRRGLRLRFVYRRTGPSLLVAESRLNTKGQAIVSRSKTGRGKVTAPIFLLVPQVKLPKRLDLARDADRALDSVPGLIVAHWEDQRV